MTITSLFRMYGSKMHHFYKQTRNISKENDSLIISTIRHQEKVFRYSGLYFRTLKISHFRMG